MLWIKEVEMVEPVDDLVSSQSNGGHKFLNFEMLDAKIASYLKKIIQNSNFKKIINLEEPKAKLDDRFFVRQNAFMIYEYFWVTGTHEAVLDYSDLFRSTLHDDDVPEFDTRWDELLASIKEVTPIRNSGRFE